MDTLVLTVHIVVAVAMIGLILLQQGKGASTGATFGGGGANTVFGAAGSGNFLSRSTAILATIFFITSLALAILAKNKVSQDYSLGPAVTQSAPAPELPGVAPGEVVGATEPTQAPAN